jgi:Crinkler effector protein N-terminal domain
MVIAVVGSINRLTKNRNVMMNYYWIACLTLLATTVSAFTVPSSSGRLLTTKISESFGLDFAEDSYENTPDKLLSTRPYSRKAMGNMLTLVCSIVGEKGSAFAVEIEENKLVDALKVSIKQRNERTITCDARELQLFLGKQSDNRWLDSNTADALTTDANGHPQGFTLMDPLLWIKNPKNFGQSFEPKEGEIHVLVVVPNLQVASEQSQEQLYDGKRKRQRIENDANPRFEIDDLTTQLKSFAKAQLVEGCIQSPDQAFLPYPQDKIQKLYVRQCYEDVFHFLIQCINLNKTSFAISGTPGIGKSLFFVYILYRLMDDFKTKTLSLKITRVIHQSGPTYECFDLEQQTVTTTTLDDAAGLVRQKDTFYIIDGRTSVPLVSSCVVLFISSPRSEEYKAFVKQKKAKKWYFPVWTLAELQTCQHHCYPDLPTGMLQERHRIYGGVARFVFHDDYSIPVPLEMESALNDVNAVCRVKYVGEITSIFPSSHTLLQIMVGDDKYGNAYQFTNLDVASKYVGEQLWIRHSAQMITNLQEMFGGSPSEISRHLFEIYGHRVFSVGGRTLKCRCLHSDIETEIQTETEFMLDTLHTQRMTFGKNAILEPKDLLGKYYEPTDDDNFPAIDSLSSQGMFQFTVAAEHPIRGVQMLRKLCQLYSEPKLYFVVPPHRFAAFKKQSFKAKTGSADVAKISNLKQYVLELTVIP